MRKDPELFWSLNTGACIVNKFYIMIYHFRERGILEKIQYVSVKFETSTFLQQNISNTPKCLFCNIFVFRWSYSINWFWNPNYFNYHYDVFSFTSLFLTRHFLLTHNKCRWLQCLMIWYDGQLKSKIISVTYYWTLSTRYKSFFRKGHQTAPIYLRIGWTQVLYISTKLKTRKRCS